MTESGSTNESRPSKPRRWWHSPHTPTEVLHSADRFNKVLGMNARNARIARDNPVAAVHLVSRQALDRAAAGEVPQGCSADDPRANLLLFLPEDDERTWVGRLLSVGDVVLEVTRTPKHCLGVYAEVRSPGVVTVGDPVRL